MPEFEVLIIGAGLGGLTLARSLRRAGIPFQIFERDQSPFDRPQGYRLHLDADAINALREVLSPDLHALFEATSQWTEPFTTILRTDLSVVKRLPTDDEHGDGVWPAREGPPVHANVDRATLRQILLARLEDAIHYGKELDRYESSADGVVAHFADGTSARGHILVGADGIRSAVRRQRAPGLDTVDAGITAIYGRVPLDRAASLVPKESLKDIFTVASDERKVFLGLGSVRFPLPPEQAAERLAPGIAMQARDDYVVCIVGGRHEYFPADLLGASGDRLQQIAAGMLGAWPSGAAAIVSAGESSAFFPIQMYTSVPFSLDAPSNVTLLGDAVHAMTPTLGRGANVAMRDGALLARALTMVASGEEGWPMRSPPMSAACSTTASPSFARPWRLGSSAWRRIRFRSDHSASRADRDQAEAPDRLTTLGRTKTYGRGPPGSSVGDSAGRSIQRPISIACSSETVEPSNADAHATGLGAPYIGSQEILMTKFASTLLPRIAASHGTVTILRLEGFAAAIVATVLYRAAVANGPASHFSSSYPTSP